MNDAFTRLAGKIGLHDPKHEEEVRLAFGCECVRRVENLLEAAAAIQCCRSLRDFLADNTTRLTGGALRTT